jgi:transposase
VPDSVDESVRDLVRAREDAVREQRNGRHRLKALLLCNGVPYAGKSSWTAAHLRWLATVKLGHTAQQIAFQEYLHAITQAGERIALLEQALRDALPDWGLKAVVQALQALRGVQLIAALTLVAELQDFLRFESPRHAQREGERTPQAVRSIGRLKRMPALYDNAAIAKKFQDTSLAFADAN